MLRLVTRKCRVPITKLEQLLQKTSQGLQWRGLASEVSNIPTEADVVVIGGGSAGCNTLYQLAREGVKAVLLERAKLTAGATWHNTGLIWTISARDIETQLHNASRNLVLRIQQETGVDPLWKCNGSIHVARTKERLEELQRLATLAKSYDVPATILTPAETKELFPLINTDVVVGALHCPNDGTADPSALCDALISGAKASGAQVVENCPVIKIHTGPSRVGGHPQVKGVVTPHGIIKTNCVVNCSGAWAGETARKAGLTLPLCIIKHAYVASESMPAVRDLPNIRDSDSSIYIRINNDQMFVGGFEHNPVVLNEMPKDFAFDLFELDWDMFQTHQKKAAELVPEFGTSGIKTSVCGPNCFTPDLMPLVGEDSRLLGMYHNVGYNSAGFMLSGGCGEQLAKWIINGRPDFHMYSCDIRRFTKEQMSNMNWAKQRSHESYVKKYHIVYPHDQPLAARNLKRDPFFEELLAVGAFYEEMQAYERPGWFTPQGHAPVPEYDWYGAYGTPRNKDKRYVNLLKGDYTFKFSKHHHLIGAECLSCRERVVMFNMSYFSKIYLTGPDAQEAANWLFTADTTGPIGKIVYSCLLNKQGGVEGDCLVVPITTGCGTQSDPIFKGRGFYIVAAGASASQSWAHMNKAIQQKGFKVALTNLAEDIGLLAIQGPKSKELLENLVEMDLSNEVFPFWTARVIKIAGHTVRALRTSFVGELGWELHIPWQSCIPVYNTIWEEGIKFGLRQAGYRALYSLSSEKGIRLWNADLKINDNPLEAGLNQTLRPEGDFLGKAAVDISRKCGLKKRHASFTIEEQVPLWGSEPIFRNEQVVGYLRRGEYGYALGKSVGQGYVQALNESEVTNEFLEGGSYHLEVMGKRYNASLTLKSPLDPANERIRGIYED